MEKRKDRKKKGKQCAIRRWGTREILLLARCVLEPRVSGEPLGPHHRSIGNVVLVRQCSSTFSFLLMFLLFGERGPSNLSGKCGQNGFILLLCITYYTVRLL